MTHLENIHVPHLKVGASVMGVKALKETDFEVVHSHINSGKDFYSYEPERWDIMVSNPPFENKREIFERAKSFKKPFALLMSLTWLNDSAPKQIFSDIDLQLLMFDKRIKFFNPEGKTESKITFSSAYYCHRFLPKQIIMEELKVSTKGWKD